MKRLNTYLHIISTLFLLSALSSCESFKDARKVEDYQLISVEVEVSSKIERVPVEGFTLMLTNIEENIEVTKVLTGKTMTLDNIPPGRYNVSVGGATTVEDENGQLKTYYMNDTKSNYPLINNGDLIKLQVDGFASSPLVIKEFYYSNSVGATGAGGYILDQFTELYNNSEKTIYLDGIHFADIHPLAATANTPNWQIENPENYVFGNRVWKFPGKGEDYPLEPGESCILAEIINDHSADNPNSPIDLTTAEFQFYLQHPTANASLPTMQHVFYRMSAGIEGSIKQYLLSNAGPAIVIFEIPEDVDWNPITNPKWAIASSESDIGKPTQRWAAIPIEWVLDGVECGTTNLDVTKKRMPGALDAGMAWVGPRFSAKSICRRPLEGTMPDGSPIFMDTNNSTVDFQIGVDEEGVPVMARDPEIRRYGTKMPSWNHTLNKTRN